MEYFRYITIFLFTLFSVCSFSMENKWSGGEHIDLGTISYQQSCYQQKQDCNEKLKRNDQYEFTYGEILAGADLYQNAEKSFNDTKNKRGLKRIFKCLDNQGKVHKEQQTHPHVEYPNCEWVVIFNKLDFLKVVSNNYDHFIWDNIKAYIKYHKQAIDFALQSFTYSEMGIPEAANELKNKALYYNAFADHFLTDAFPAGHIRVPRREISNWAKKNLYGILKKARGDALSALLHNSEGLNVLSGVYQGIEVKNSIDQEWVTVGDGLLHSNLNGSNKIRKQIIVDAVTASINEVFESLNGNEPLGIYQATIYVPFPKEDLSLKYLLPKNKKQKKRFIKKHKKLLPLALQLITSTNDIRKLFNSLYKINNKFKKRIKSEVNENSELNKRIAKKYLDYFLKNE